MKRIVLALVILGAAVFQIASAQGREPLIQGPTRSSAARVSLSAGTAIITGDGNGVDIFDQSIESTSNVQATYDTVVQPTCFTVSTKVVCVYGDPIAVNTVTRGSFHVDGQVGQTFHWLAYNP